MTRWFKDALPRPITWNNDFPGFGSTTVWIVDSFETGGTPTSWDIDPTFPMTAIWFEDTNPWWPTWTED